MSKWKFNNQTEDPPLSDKNTTTGFRKFKDQPVGRPLSNKNIEAGHFRQFENQSLGPPFMDNTGFRKYKNQPIGAQNKGRSTEYFRQLKQAIMGKKEEQLSILLNSQSFKLSDSFTKDEEFELNRLILQEYGVNSLESLKILKSSIDPQEGHYFNLKQDNSIVKPNVDVPTNIKPLFDMSGFTDNYVTHMKLKYYQVMQIISKSSLSIEEYETAIAGSLVRAMSGKNHTKDDITLVKKHFASFMSLLVSCFVVYNWFFVMYFTESNGERVKTLELSLTKIKQDSPIFHFFFKYTLCVLSMMDKFVLDIVPSMVSKILVDRRIQFITLFVSVYMIINNFGSIILNSVDSKIVVAVYVGIFVLYELYCVLMDFLPDENGSIDISRLHKYMVFGSVTPLLYLMLFFIRMIWSIVTIGIASFINCAYILLMSFFAIPIYSSSFFSTFKKLNDFIWDSKETKSGPIELCTNILYRFLYEFSFILILLFGIFDYSSNMSRVSQMLTIINCICYALIFFFAFIVYQRYLLNGSLSAYIDPTDNIPPSKQSSQSPQELVTQNNIINESQYGNENDNNKFNFSENKLIDTNNSLLNEATNMVQSKLVDTVMKSVKNSKYGKMIPTKLLSSIM